MFSFDDHHSPGRPKGWRFDRDRFSCRQWQFRGCPRIARPRVRGGQPLRICANDWPAIFGIDNIETALNPQLCRDLIKQLAILASKNGKQALITTHNPAILDGLNLHDDEQRLFVVYRTDEGYTRTRRIKVKPDAGEPLKLSELWMRGYLGGLPQGF